MRSSIRMVISIVLSLLVVLIITSVISYFLYLKDNRQSLNVYVDSDGKIYVNGVISTEQHATQLVNDPAYIPSIRYHPGSPVHYCFGQCM